MLARPLRRLAALVTLLFALIVGVDFATAAFDNGATLVSVSPTAGQGSRAVGASSLSDDGRYVAFGTDSNELYPDTVDLQPVTNKVQRVTVDATGGTFTLSFDGETTAAIAENAAAGAVETAFEGLNDIAPDEITVSGAAGGPWVVNFYGRYQGLDVPAMTASAGGLTGGTASAKVESIRSGIVGGLFRKDLSTGTLDVVALGSLCSRPTGVPTATPSCARRAMPCPAPCMDTSAVWCGPDSRGTVSVSGDGRFVAFTTEQKLRPEDGNYRPDVYVRDMQQPLSSPSAFTLISARNGTNVSGSYAPSLVAGLGCRDGSALADGGRAIDGDGDKVIFRTAVKSDLPSEGALSTPEDQLLVRDLSDSTTTLVTRTKSDGTAHGTPTGGCTLSDPDDVCPVLMQQAVISEDGSTVAWIGPYADEQTKFISGEASYDPATDSLGEDTIRPYMMWRRIADGPGASTKRITGEADPGNPACTGSINDFNPATEDPDCYGPLEDVEGSQCSPMGIALSGDGRSAAYTACADVRGAPLGQGANTDLFLVNMNDGVGRVAGTRELTRGPTGNDRPDNQSIARLALSSDGQHVSFMTARVGFVLPTPSVVGALPATPDRMRAFTIDAKANTLELATRAADGSDVGTPANGLADAYPITASGTGARIAFTAKAANLAPGDANGFPDIFVANRTAGGDPGPGDPGPGDPGPGGPGGRTPDAPGPGGPGPGGPGGQPGFGGSPAVAASIGALGKTGALKVTLANSNAFQVTGSAALTSTKALPAARKPKGKSKAKKVTFGNATFRIPARGKVTITIKLSAKNRGLVKRLKSVKATLKVTLRDPAGGTRTVSKAVTLKPPPKGTRKRK